MGYKTASAVVGLKVELPVGSDKWMQGARFGIITGIRQLTVTDSAGSGKRQVVRIKLDNTSRACAKSVYFPLADLNRVSLPSEQINQYGFNGGQDFEDLVTLYSQRRLDIRGGDWIGAWQVSQVTGHTVSVTKDSARLSTQIPFVDGHGNLTRHGELMNHHGAQQTAG